MSDQDLSELAGRITGRVTEVFDDFERMKQPRAGELKSISTNVTARAMQELKGMARAWNVSVSSLVRLALWETMRRYQFDASSILDEVDRRAMSRIPRARRPFLSSDECQNRRARLVFAQHHGGDDPPGS